MTAMIACGACGQRFAVGAPHPCFDKAQEAVRENDLEAPPDPVRHGRPRAGVESGKDGLRFERDPVRHARAADPDGDPPLYGPDHPLAYYRDIPAKLESVSADQHLCLCPACADVLRTGDFQRRLRFVAYIEGEHATNFAALSTAADDDPCWRPDVDGCDACGVPPSGQERVRTGPSEWFQILYLDDDTEWPQ